MNTTKHRRIVRRLYVPGNCTIIYSDEFLMIKAPFQKKHSVRTLTEEFVYTPEKPFNTRSPSYETVYKMSYVVDSITYEVLVYIEALSEYSALTLELIDKALTNEYNSFSKEILTYEDVQLLEEPEPYYFGELSLTAVTCEDLHIPSSNLEISFSIICFEDCPVVYDSALYSVLFLTKENIYAPWDLKMNKHALTFEMNSLPAELEKHILTQEDIISVLTEGFFTYSMKLLTEEQISLFTENAYAHVYLVKEYIVSIGELAIELYALTKEVVSTPTELEKRIVTRENIVSDLAYITYGITYEQVQ